MAIAKWMGFGSSNSNDAASNTPAGAVSERKISSADYKQFGFENFGNICYCNSVLQTLYFCHPFRELVLQTPDESITTGTTTAAPATLPPTPGPTAPVTPLTTTSAPATTRIKPTRRTTASAAEIRQASTSESGSGSAGSGSGAASSSALSPNTTAAPPSHSTGPPIPPSPPTLFSALRSLFLHISENTLDRGTIIPRAFVDKVKSDNVVFKSPMQQDAHEFLNYLLNRVAEDLEEEAKKKSKEKESAAPKLELPSTDVDMANGTDKDKDAAGADVELDVDNTSDDHRKSVSTSSAGSPPTTTLVHKLFEGALTSETRCLTCETVSSRDESFLDLSIDIEQNSSVTACLRQFSASEMLCQKNKFFCDSCCGLQEAEKRMKIKKLPNVLALHLKRFKYQEDVGKYIKLTYRVAFPLQLRLFNTVDDVQDPDRLYELFAILVHIGNGPHHGHYVSVVKSRGTWFVFDDDCVEAIKESDIPKYFGDSNSGSAYVLYYQAVDIDLEALGLKPKDVVAAGQGLASSVANSEGKTKIIEVNDADASLSDEPTPLTATPTANAASVEVEGEKGQDARSTVPTPNGIKVNGTTETSSTSVDPPPPVAKSQSMSLSLTIPTLPVSLEQATPASAEPSSNSNSMQDVKTASSSGSAGPASVANSASSATPTAGPSSAASPVAKATHFFSSLRHTPTTKSLPAERHSRGRSSYTPQSYVGPIPVPGPLPSSSGVGAGVSTSANVGVNIAFPGASPTTPMVNGEAGSSSATAGAGSSALPSPMANGKPKGAIETVSGWFPKRRASKIEKGHGQANGRGRTQLPHSQSYPAESIPSVPSLPTSPLLVPTTHTPSSTSGVASLINSTPASSSAPTPSPSLIPSTPDMPQKQALPTLPDDASFVTTSSSSRGKYTEDELGPNANTNGLVNGNGHYPNLNLQLQQPERRYQDLVRNGSSSQQHLLASRSSSVARSASNGVPQAGSAGPGPAGPGASSEELRPPQLRKRVSLTLAGGSVSASSSLMGENSESAVGSVHGGVPVQPTSSPFPAPVPPHPASPTHRKSQPILSLASFKSKSKSKPGSKGSKSRSRSQTPSPSRGGLIINLNSPGLRGEDDVPPLPPLPVGLVNGHGTGTPGTPTAPSFLSSLSANSNGIVLNGISKDIDKDKDKGKEKEHEDEKDRDQPSTWTMSVKVASNAAATMRRTTRKLSLSGGMLGFGRKERAGESKERGSDRDRDSHTSKTKEHREKEKDPFSTLVSNTPPGYSLTIGRI